MTIFHRHRYKIIGIGDLNEQSFSVDVICKCGKTGTLTIPIEYKGKVLQQAVEDKYLNVPCIINGNAI